MVITGMMFSAIGPATIVFRYIPVMVQLTISLFPHRGQRYRCHYTAVCTITGSFKEKYSINHQMRIVCTEHCFTCFHLQWTSMPTVF